MPLSVTTSTKPIAAGLAHYQRPNGDASMLNSVIKLTIQEMDYGALLGEEWE